MCEYDDFEECESCDGGGLCPGCDGAGEPLDSEDATEGGDCVTCGGDGVCADCGGAGGMG